MKVILKVHKCQKQKETFSNEHDIGLTELAKRMQEKDKIGQIR